MVATMNSAQAAAPSFASSAKPAGNAQLQRGTRSDFRQQFFFGATFIEHYNNAPTSTNQILNSNNADTNNGSVAGSGGGSGKSAPVPGPAAVPQQTLSNQALRQNVVRNANTSTDNSVQSFFQCAPINVTSKEIERRQTSEEKKGAASFR